MVTLPARNAIRQWMILPLRRYARFTGRSGRREFWWFSVLQFAVYIAVVGVLFGAIWAGDDLDEASDASAIGVVIAFGTFVIFWLAMFVPTLAVTVRRLHDIGISGWVALPLYLACLFLSIIGWIVYAIVMALPGKDIVNQYGPPVYGDQLATVFE